MIGTPPAGVTETAISYSPGGGGAMMKLMVSDTVCPTPGSITTMLYGHFGSKEQILAEIIASAHCEHFRRVSAALLESGADPIDQLSAVARAHVLVLAEYPIAHGGRQLRAARPVS